MEHIPVINSVLLLNWRQLRTRSLDNRLPLTLRVLVFFGKRHLPAGVWLLGSGVSMHEINRATADTA